MAGTPVNERRVTESICFHTDHYEATRTLGQDVRKVFSADLEQNTLPSVWSRRTGVRDAKQIPPTGWSLGLAGNGSDPQPP